MSWSQFASLIGQDNRSIADWKSAIDGNPNTPEAALKIAIMHFVQNKDMVAIEDISSFIVSLVKTQTDLMNALQALLISIDQTDPNKDGDEIVFRLELIGEEKRWYSGEDLQAWAYKFATTVSNKTNGEQPVADEPVHAEEEVKS